MEKTVDTQKNLRLTNLSNHVKESVKDIIKVNSIDVVNGKISFNDRHGKTKKVNTKETVLFMDPEGARFLDTGTPVIFITVCKHKYANEYYDEEDDEYYESEDDFEEYYEYKANVF